LTERLTPYVRSSLVAQMETKPEGVEKGRVMVGAMNSDKSQGVRYSSDGPVLSDLLKSVPSLMSEEPRESFRFFCEL
jgi:hypothetical protein